MKIGKFLIGVGVAAGLALVGTIIYGYAAKPGWVGVADKTLWDWLQLLIIPFVLAVGGTVGGYLFTRSENRNAQMIADNRAQDEALQAYLDQMSTLLLTEDNPFRAILARAHTLTALKRLDSDRIRNVMNFLQEAELIQGDRLPRQGNRFKITLQNADLSGVDLSESNLSGIDLRGANLKHANLGKVNLKDADLREANLSGTVLEYADLAAAKLNDTNLSGADLSNANLRMAFLNNALLDEATKLINADLSHAVLARARVLGRVDLSKVNLTETSLLEVVLPYAVLNDTVLRDALLERADLRHAQLVGANLQGAHLRRASLNRANLQGADLRKAELGEVDLSEVELPRSRGRVASTPQLLLPL
jgi:uncharacterized protein YjbI with pentapeptide repeats